jgi:hypothetical protein
MDRVCEAIVAWRKGHHKDVTWRSVEEPLSTALSLLGPLTTLRRRELLLSTKSPWTAYFDNSARGGDPFGTASQLALAMKCRSLAVRCVPQTLKSERRDAVGTYGAVTFELFAPEQREWLNYERAIGVGNDGGRWLFRDEGKPLPFERTERYKARKIRDRFTPELLEEYCAALGIRLFDEHFYGPHGVLVTVHDPLPNGHKAISLDEARANLGLSSTS